MDKSNSILSRRTRNRNDINTQYPTKAEENKLIIHKRRRAKHQPQHQLTELFEKLDAEPYDLEDIPSKTSPPIDPLRHVSDTEETEEHLVKMASQFLDESQSERLKEALVRQSSNNVGDRRSHHWFFQQPTQIPVPVFDASYIPPAGQTGQGKEGLVNKLSKTVQGRSFLLHSGCLRHWFERGWECPSSIYEWLFEIVAFEKDIMTAKHAYDTLHALWVNLGAEQPQYHNGGKDGQNQNRHILFHNFTHVLRCYGSQPSDIPHEESANNDISSDWSKTAQENGKINALNDQGELSLVQLKWILQLFGYSIKAWPQAYTLDNLENILQIALRITLDYTGRTVLLELQTIAKSCLAAMPQNTWQQKVQSLASFVHERFPTMNAKLQLFKITDPTCERSVYMSRIFAWHALMNHTERNSMSMRHSVENIHAWTVKMLDDKSTVFQQKDTDFVELASRTRLLDIAIGSCESELRREQQAIRTVVGQLQSLERRTGSRVGVLERTVANEAVQRLWNRLTYVIERDRSTTAEY